MPRRTQLLLLAVGVGLGVFIYGWGLGYPLIFDDLQAVSHNLSIHRLWPLSVPLHPPDDSPLAVRPLVNLSLAINYHFGGIDPVGYRIVNLVIHLASALLLFGVLRRSGELVTRLVHPPLPLGEGWGEGTSELGKVQPAGKLSCSALPSPVPASRATLSQRERGCDLFAAAVALLWLVHPLNTEAVIYITQRTELMVSFFYLLTLYAAIRGFFSQRGWFFVAVVACAAGMASKEIMVSAPIFVLLYDRTLVSGTFRNALKKSPWLYLGLAATWGLLAFLLATQSRGQSAGLAAGIPPLQYLRTQAGVILWYLRLCIWPSPLTVAHNWPLSTGWLASLPAGLCIIALLAATGWLLWKRSWLGLLGAWMFMILAPTSSVVPIATEIAAERRMYLPLAAVLVAVILVVQRFATWARRDPDRERRVLMACFLYALFMLTFSSSVRVGDYSSVVFLWSDAVRKDPHNDVALHNLAGALYEEKQYAAALDRVDEAIRVDPTNYSTYTLRGQILADMHRPNEALASFRRSIALKPDQFAGHQQLGRFYADHGHLDEAIAELRKAVAIDPHFAEAYNLLGAALYLAAHKPPPTSGPATRPAINLDEPIRYYREAIRLDPDYAEPHNNLGTALGELNQPAEAIGEYEEAIRLKPGFFEAHVNLARGYARVGRLPEAAAAFEAALKLHPEDALLHNQLGIIFAQNSQMDRAADEFRRAVTLKPDYADAQANLARATGKN